jgi:integrase
MPLILDLEFLHEGDKLKKLGDIPVNRIDVKIVESWRRKLRTTKCRATVLPKPGEPYRELDRIISPGYRNRLLTTLQSIVSYALGGKQHSPLRGMSRENTKDRKRKGCFQTESHLEAFLAHVPAWLADMARLAAGPGCMRLSEVLYLSKSEVNWSQKSITLPPHRTKNREGRTFPVSDSDMEMLRARAVAAGRSPYIFAKQSIDKESGEHLPFHPSYVTRLMQRAATASGIKLGLGSRPTFHFLRRTGATWTLLKSDNTFRLQKHGGWKDPAVMNDYLDETKEMIDEAEDLANVPPSVALARRREALKGLKRDEQS